MDVRFGRPGEIGAGPRTYLIWFMSLGLSSGMSDWGPLSFAQTFAGPRAAGKWGALQNGFANFAGIFSSMITGFLVHWADRFTAPLALSACVALLGTFSWRFVTAHEPGLEESFTPSRIGETAVSSPRSN